MKQNRFCRVLHNIWVTQAWVNKLRPAHNTQVKVKKYRRGGTEIKQRELQGTMFK